MTDWTLQEKLADEILDNPAKVLYVDKQGTRLGATTSIVKRAIERGMKVTLIEPFHIIFNETFYKDILPLTNLKLDEDNYFNGHLMSVKEMCERKSELPYIPFAFKGTCEGLRWNKKLKIEIPYRCSKFNHCKFQKYIQSDSQVNLLSYTKFNMLVKYYDTEYFNNIGDEDNYKNIMVRKILNSDLIFLDEYSHSIYKSPYQIDVKVLNNILTKILPDIEDDHCSINGIEYYYLWEKLNSLLMESINSPDNKKLYSVSKDIGIMDFELISEWISAYKLNKLEQKTLLDAIQCLEFEEFYIEPSRRKVWNHLKKVYEYQEFIALIPDMFHPIIKFSEGMLQNFKGKIRITDAILPSTRILQGESIHWPDFKKTQNTQLIVCDTRSSPLAVYTSGLSTYAGEYLQEIDRLKEFIKEMCIRFGADKFLIFCINKSTYEKIAGWQDEFKGLKIAEYPRVHYFRQGTDVGIHYEKTRRCLICVNLPETPLDNLYGFAKVFHKLKDYDKYRKCQQVYMDFIDDWGLNEEKLEKRLIDDIHKNVRFDEQKNVFINAIGRVKDSKGIENSMVIVWGETYGNVIKYLPKNRFKIVSPANGHFGSQIVNMYSMWMINGNKKHAEYRAIPVHASITDYLIQHPKESYNISELSNALRIDKNLIVKACTKFSYLVGDRYYFDGKKIRVDDVEILKKLSE